MSKTFEFEYDVAFIRGALRRDFLWKGYVLAGMFVVMAFFVALLNGGFDLWLTGSCLLGAGIVLWRFRSMLSRMAGQVHEMWVQQAPSGKIRYELDDEGFEVVLETGRNRFEWAKLRRLWRYRDVWMLEIVKMQSVFFPPDQAPDDVREFIVERCEASGIPT